MMFLKKFGVEILQIYLLHQLKLSEIIAALTFTAIFRTLLV
jgi:hypothetical protein